jgi:hypothetical protein
MPCGTWTGIATLQTLRSKDLLVEPPASTTKASNRIDSEGTADEEGSDSQKLLHDVILGLLRAPQLARVLA